MKNALRTLLFGVCLFSLLALSALASVEVRADISEQVALPEGASEAECLFTPTISGYYRVLLQDENNSSIYLRVYDADGAFVADRSYYASESDDGLISWFEAGSPYTLRVRVYRYQSATPFTITVERYRGLVSASAANEYVPVLPNAAATLTVNASVSESAVTYRWYRRVDYVDVQIDGADGASYMTAPIDRQEHYRCTVEDDYGHSASVDFNVYIDNQLTASITGSAYGYGSLYVPLNERLTLTVSASCAVGGLHYQWEKHAYRSAEYGDYDSITLSETGSTIQTDPVNYKCKYLCRVSDDYGNERYTLVTLYVDSGFTLSNQYWTTLSVPYGETTRLSVEAACDYTLHYQWSVYDENDNEEDLSCALSFLDLEAINAPHSYLCRVSDDYGQLESCGFEVCVENGLWATAIGGERHAVAYGGDITLTTFATCGRGALRYEWYGDVDDDECSGNKCAIKNVTSALEIYCDVSDAYGNRTFVVFQVDIENGLYVNPVGETERVVEPDQSLTLRVDAGCVDGALSYRWDYVESTDYAYGEQLSTASSVTLSHSRTGIYYCHVTDRFGNQQSIHYTIVVDNLTVSAVGDAVIRVANGESATMRVDASVKAGEIHYQWELNGWSVDQDTTHASYTLVNPTQSTEIACRVTDDYGNKETIRYLVSVAEIIPLSEGQTVQYACAPENSRLWVSFTPASTGYYRFDVDNAIDAWFDEMINTNGRETAARLGTGKLEGAYIYKLTKGNTYHCEIGHAPRSYSAKLSLSVRRLQAASGESYAMRVGQYALLPEVTRRNTVGIFSSNPSVASIPYMDEGGVSANRTGSCSVTVITTDGLIEHTISVYDDASTLRLPDATTAIEESAFAGDTKIAFVELGDAMRSVEAGAFADTGLRQILASNYNTAFATDAVSGEAPTIFCSKGSRAERWATANGFPCLYFYHWSLDTLYDEDVAG